MKLKSSLFTAAACVTAAIALSCAAAPAAAPATPDTEAIAFVRGLGLGYNLGNTLDACGGSRGGKIENFEVAWGAPRTTKPIFEDLKRRGFDTIRIPVAWSNLMGDDYAIHPGLMDRVEEIVRMVLDSGMYAIVNIHWDGGWITTFPTDYDECMKKFTRIWSQVSARFKDFDERLIFESLNEEGCFSDVWNRYSDGDGEKKVRAFAILNTINQTFVDLVRAAGGRNAGRYLLIAGYGTDIDLTCAEEFKMPVDKARHSIVSVHYYEPSTFAILEKDADWGKVATTWGSESEVEEVAEDFGMMKATFIDKGIPVILGEYGTATIGKDPESVRKYLTVVAQTAWRLGLCPILWGASDQHYNRVAMAFTDPLLGQMYLDLAKTAR